jgi:hypothetical protein
VAIRFRHCGSSAFHRSTHVKSPVYYGLRALKVALEEIGYED